MVWLWGKGILALVHQKGLLRPCDLDTISVPRMVLTRMTAATVRARLLAIAKKSDFNQVLVRYALERILYRLSQSRHADHFLHRHFGKTTCHHLIVTRHDQ